MPFTTSVAVPCATDCHLLTEGYISFTPGSPVTELHSQRPKVAPNMAPSLAPFGRGRCAIKPGR
ncbi:MAG: hypothetical protein Q7U30_12830, partial [Methylicorpusculum sp.]|nr:hypothetical protein [Methylicorpusculum sp.]